MPSRSSTRMRSTVGIVAGAVVMGLLVASPAVASDGGSADVVGDVADSADSTDSPDSTDMGRVADCVDTEVADVDADHVAALAAAVDPSLVCLSTAEAPTGSEPTVTAPADDAPSDAPGESGPVGSAPVEPGPVESGPAEPPVEATTDEGHGPPPEPVPSATDESLVDDVPPVAGVPDGDAAPAAVPDCADLPSLSTGTEEGVTPDAELDAAIDAVDAYVAGPGADDFGGLWLEDGETISRVAVAFAADAAVHEAALLADGVPAARLRVVTTSITYTALEDLRDRIVDERETLDLGDAEITVVGPSPRLQRVTVSFADGTEEARAALGAAYDPEQICIDGMDVRPVFEVGTDVLDDEDVVAGALAPDCADVARLSSGTPGVTVDAELQEALDAVEGYVGGPGAADHAGTWVENGPEVGRVVVAFVDDVSEHRSALEALVADDRRVEVVEATHTAAALAALQDDIDAAGDDLDDVEIVGTGLVTDRNRVGVDVIGLDDEARAELSAEFDPSAICLTAVTGRPVVDDDDDTDVAGERLASTGLDLPSQAGAGLAALVAGLLLLLVARRRRVEPSV